MLEHTPNFDPFAFWHAPAWLKVFFCAMIPIAELRAAIPYGIFALGLNPFVAFFWAVLGNFVPNIFILYLLPKFSDGLRKHWHWWDNFLKKIHDNNSESFKKRGEIFITLFIGVPIPGSGSWTGSVLAYLFNVPYKTGLIVVFLGVTMAGLIVLGASTGIFALVKNLFLG